MNIIEFTKRIDNEVGIEWKEGTYEGRDGVFVLNKNFGTVTHLTLQSIMDNHWEVLITQTHHGRNVEQMTRVTGYFSKTRNWNGGKIAELRDRFRNQTVPLKNGGE